VAAVLRFVEPWVSSEDIPKGTRWGIQLASELEGTHSGIICLVHDNLTEPWLNFEAGALSKSIVTARIHPFLVGMNPGELTGPVAQFQATRYSKDDTRKLIHALNSDAGAASLSTEKVNRSFDVCWPNLESRLEPLHLESFKDLIGDPPGPRETQRDLTAEELNILRVIANNSEGLSPDEAQGLVPLHTQHIQHIMESLEGKGLLDVADNYLDGPSWHLSREGRAFLVKMNVLRATNTPPRGHPARSSTFRLSQFGGSLRYALIV